MKNVFAFGFFLISTFVVVAASSPYQFISPMPDAHWVNLEHNIVIRPGAALFQSSVRASEFSIVGSKSGKHDFTLIISADGKTINLNPLSPFEFNEVVTVTIKQGIKTLSHDKVSAFEFSFTTHREFTTVEKQEIESKKEMVWQKRMNLHPSEEFSDNETRNVEGLLKININSNPGPGDIFFDTWSANSQQTKYNGYQIISIDGDSLFQRRMDYALDFKLQGNGYFTVFHAYTNYDVLDSSFNVIDQIFAANGYRADGHELLITSENHYLMIADEYQFVNMKIYDPDYSPNCLVNGSVIQELDENKTLIFEWRSFDHIEIPEALHVNLAASSIDYTHTNSLEVDYDGNILASHRHLDQVTKIDRSTGEFIWRLGGVKNEFTFTNDTAGFNFQHDVRRLNNGNITLFDNGNFHVPARTYVKEYQLDETNKTATLIWSYSRPKENGSYFFYEALGSAQRLSNGNTFINWGWRQTVEQPSMTEVTTDGEIVWEATLTSKKEMVSYRAHKYDYNACARATYNRMWAQYITPVSATLKWSPAWRAVKYELQYSKLPEGIWKQVIVNSQNLKKTISNLEPNSVYEWKLKTWCDENGMMTSNFTMPKKFKTLPARNTLTEFSDSDIFLYPNPASDVVAIESGDNLISEVRVFNLLGQEITNLCYFDKSPTHRIELSLNTINAGNYVVEVVAKGKHQFKKLVVE